MSRMLDRVRKDVAVTVPADESASDRHYRQTYLHPCAVPSCGLWIAKGYVACAPHYLCIPQEWRDLLGQAFRARTLDPDLYALAVTKARQLLGAS